MSLLSDELGCQIHSYIIILYSLSVFHTSLTATTIGVNSAKIMSGLNSCLKI